MDELIKERRTEKRKKKVNEGSDKTPKKCDYSFTY
jgi:hypothetical protein